MGYKAQARGGPWMGGRAALGVGEARRKNWAAAHRVRDLLLVAEGVLISVSHEVRGKVIG